MLSEAVLEVKKTGHNNEVDECDIGFVCHYDLPNHMFEAGLVMINIIYKLMAVAAIKSKAQVMFRLG